MFACQTISSRSCAPLVCMFAFCRSPSVFPTKSCSTVVNLRSSLNLSVPLPTSPLPLCPSSSSTALQGRHCGLPAKRSRGAGGAEELGTEGAGEQGGNRRIRREGKIWSRVAGGVRNTEQGRRGGRGARNSTSRGAEGLGCRGAEGTWEQGTEIAEE